MLLVSLLFASSDQSLLLFKFNKKMSLQILKLKKQVGIAIKISSQPEPVTNSYVIIMHQPVTVSSSTYSQKHVQTKHSLAHLKD